MGNFEDYFCFKSRFSARPRHGPGVAGEGAKCGRKEKRKWGRKVGEREEGREMGE